MSEAQVGLVVAGHGRHFVVETPHGERLICHPRGKKSEAVVGDKVRWQPSQDEGTIEAVLARRNLFWRQDEVRSKMFAANIDQVLILIAADPVFSEQQLARALIAAEAEGITPIIALNKRDLGLPFERAWQRLLPYAATGYELLPLALKDCGDEGTARLRALLDGKTTLTIGPSGAGKSTLTNCFVPGAAALTREVSKALNSGKHTTTSTTWYWLDADRTSALIDSPGFQEFGLQHIDPMRLAKLMPDLAPLTENCRFYNCTHMHEP
ncbi:MAG: ribosome small subunit-dependent GTPase A, partial [Burkholderiales bacterium]